MTCFFLELAVPNPVTLIAKIEYLKHRLIRLHEVMKNRFPVNSHSIPVPEQIDIQKLRHGGVITTDNCNQAQKVRHLLLCQLLDEPAWKKEGAKCQGLFHGLSDELRQTIVLVAMEDAPSTRIQNRTDIQAQDTARREKEELYRETNMENATEEYIEGLYYH